MEPRAWLAALIALVCLSCSRGAPSTQTAPAPLSYYGDPADSFRDDATTNAQVSPDALELSFVDSHGKPVDLKSYRGKKHILLVMTRGFAGSICPICTAQTSRLIANYAEFVKRDTEVLAVFPGPSEHVKDFTRAAQQSAANQPVPFPVLLDEDFRATDRLGIRADLAKPSTYLIDKDGNVRFAYVGATTTDRPSIQAILQQLDAVVANR